MANGLYDSARDAHANGLLSWSADTIKAILVDTALYTVDLATHNMLDDVPAGARIAISAALTGKTSSAGIVDAENGLFNDVSGATAEGIILFKDTGVEATSRLWAWWDTATGLPLTPNGGNVSLAWDNGSLKIFKL